MPMPLPQQTASHPHAPEAAQDRRNRILDAAERCFVRSGFHRTTMQDVAAEAGMSAGNLYRYFASKEAIHTGLAERDRERMAADFARLLETDDFLQAFEALGRKHLVDDPREKAVLALEIYAEACRNPSVLLLCGGMDGEVRGFMREVFASAQRKGFIAPGVDPDWLVWLLMTVADGLGKRRALDPDFDGEAELARGMQLFRAAFAGALGPSAGGALPSQENPT